jgi:hypothetical protein
MKLQTIHKLDDGSYWASMFLTDEDIEMLEAFAYYDISAYERLSKYNVRFKRCYQTWIEKTFHEFQKIWKKFD